MCINDVLRFNAQTIQIVLPSSLLQWHNLWAQRKCNSCSKLNMSTMFTVAMKSVCQGSWWQLVNRTVRNIKLTHAAWGITFVERAKTRYLYFHDEQSVHVKTFKTLVQDLVLMDNTSTVFTLSGLDMTTDYRTTLFSLTLMCYCVIIMVNVALILTIVLDENLQLTCASVACWGLQDSTPSSFWICCLIVMWFLMQDV